MLKAAHRFKNWLAVIGTGFSFVFVCSLANAGEAGVEIKKNQTGLYRDVFDQNIYYEGVQYFHLERLYRDLFHKKNRARNLNVFDEVPDSSFFTNRHARTKLSLEEIEQGYRETQGPDLSSNLMVIKGKFEGQYPGFFVKDARGDQYLIKFDGIEAPELATSAEVIASRLYYAIGYNVPQYTIAVVDSRKLVPAPEATVVDDTGFKKVLTSEKLTQYLLFIPQDANGHYRASASKVLTGVNKGNFSFAGRRKSDPEDRIDHQDRREIRTLQVFSAWLNNTDMRESNTLDMLVEENGRQVLRHYLIDFNLALGSGPQGVPKAPMLAHEYTMDYGEALKAFFTLGWWEKPWQKRWEESGQQIESPSVGYFDNRYFNPGRYKTQLPYYAFKDVTRADGFWAAKIIMSFTDEEIKMAVRAGQLSNSGDAERIAAVLAERRDMIGRYWFSKAAPLDSFELSETNLIFEDLAVKYGFEKKESSRYRVDVFRVEGKKSRKIETLETQDSSLDLSRWQADAETLELFIRPQRNGSKTAGSYVFVRLNRQGVTNIVHED